jgi:glycosyltransferase involved in cell wall biosynthesis
MWMGWLRPYSCAGADLGSTTSKPRRVVVWGTYDLGKPRTRILIRALRTTDVELIECHADVWAGVEDKGRPGGWLRVLGGIFRSHISYPALIWRYMRLPPHDAVVVGYFGHLDVIVLWPFARLRRVPVLWDAFLSLHETAVADRRMVRRWNPVAGLLWLWDWLAARAASLVVLDTKAHADWFAATFGLRAGRVAWVFVGAEPETFAPLPAPAPRAPDAPIRILFYGQFIALHGIDTIVEAASRSDPSRYIWTLIGTGQEAPGIRRRLDAHPVANLKWIEWVPYAELREHIGASDICLGIFGQSGKAARVIPNKVFQILSCGRPLVTRDSPAMRELLAADTPGVRLVAPGDPDALLSGIEGLVRSRDLPPPDSTRQFALEALGEKIVGIIRRAAELI